MDNNNKQWNAGFSSRLAIGIALGAAFGMLLPVMKPSLYGYTILTGTCRWSPTFHEGAIRWANGRRPFDSRKT